MDWGPCPCRCNSGACFRTPLVSGVLLRDEVKLLKTGPSRLTCVCVLSDSNPFWYQALAGVCVPSKHRIPIWQQVNGVRPQTSWGGGGATTLLVGDLYSNHITPFW